MNSMRCARESVCARSATWPNAPFVSAQSTMPASASRPRRSPLIVPASRRARCGTTRFAPRPAADVALAFAVRRQLRLAQRLLAQFVRAELEHVQRTVAGVVLGLLHRP